MPVEDRIAAAWDVVGRTVKQALASAREAPAGDEHAHIRARIESVEISENYRYSQEISRNAETRTEAAPTGAIEIRVPYDGSRYLTRQALADVEHDRRGGLSAVKRDALIGHLLFIDHGHTDLRHVAGLSDRYGSLPVILPLDDDDLDQLVADERACEISVDYSPSDDWPRVFPMDVQLELHDPDSLELFHTDLLNSSNHTLVAERISQQVAFRRHLMLDVVVTLRLPRGAGLQGVTPRVRKCSVKWPTVTSLHALSVVDDDGREIPFTYNAESRALEWEDVPMTRQSTSDGDLRVYESARTSLLIRQPGELYQGESLTGLVEVEIPGRLVSGVDCRVHDASGAIDERDPVKMTTTLSTAFTLILDDAFARRILSPMQHLHFDEVIPETMRIADIESALRDRGFTTDKAPLTPEPGYDLRHLVTAQRQEGPHQMRLLLLVQGKRYGTKRQTQKDGGHTFTSKFESGEMTVYMLGSLPRDSREVTHEMNELQRALRERFHRVRARR